MAETLPPLQIPITGDATGAVNALEAARKKVAELAAQENILKAAMDSVNKETEEGARTFALLRVEAEKLQAQTRGLDKATAQWSATGKLMQERVSKASASLSAMSSVAGDSGGKIGQLANAGNGLAQAFATGGPIAAGIAAATIALGALNTKIGEYIEKAAEAETKRIVSEGAVVVAGSLASRELAGRTAALKEQLGVVSKIELLERERAALDERERRTLAVLNNTKPRTADEIAALPGYKKSLIDIRDQRFLIGQAIDQEVKAQQDAMDAQEKSLAAAEKQKKVAEDLLRLTRARAALSDANAAMALAAEDRALGLDNPDPGAGLFKEPTPIASEEFIKAMNELFISAPTIEFADGIIEGAIAIEELSKAAEDASSALQAGLQKSAMSFVTSLASGDLRGVGSSVGAGLGAIAGANIAQGLTGVDPAMAEGLGGALGGIVGSALGDAANQLVDIIMDVGAELEAFAPLIDSVGVIVHQLEPLWETLADVSDMLASALLYLSPIIRLLAEAINVVIAPLGGLAQAAADAMEVGIVPFTIAMSKAINAIIDVANAFSMWMNNTFGTELEMLSHVIVDDLIDNVEDAGESIRENLTDEFVNLPPGFKTSAAIFGATAPGAGAGTGGVNIGVVNVTARGTLLDEINDIGRRANIGSSGILAGRTTVQDRRN